MADNPVRDIGTAVGRHFDAAVGTHVRAVRGAADIGGRIVDAADQARSAVRDWWEDDGRGNRRRKHGDLRLPNEGPRRKRKAKRASGR